MVDLKIALTKLFTAGDELQQEAAAFIPTKIIASIVESPLLRARWLSNWG